MQEHFKSMGYKFEDDLLQRFNNIYTNNNSMENYPVSFSATIK